MSARTMASAKADALLNLQQPAATSPQTDASSRSPADRRARVAARQLLRWPTRRIDRSDHGRHCHGDHTHIRDLARLYTHVHVNKANRPRTAPQHIRALRNVFEPKPALRVSGRLGDDFAASRALF